MLRRKIRNDAERQRATRLTLARGLDDPGSGATSNSSSISRAEQHWDISGELTADLLKQGLRLVTGLRKNMREQLRPLWDKRRLRKRSLIETVIDQLQNISQIEHSRHRSPTNFLVNLFAGLIADTHPPKKTSLNLTPHESQQLVTR